MAEYFEEVETQRILVDTLLEVNAYGSMRFGDMIVVSNATTSVRLPSGTNNQILVTDTVAFPTTAIGWKSVSSALAGGIPSLATGDIIYYDGSSFQPRHAGINGYVLVYSNASASPVYQSISQTLGFNASGQIIYSTGSTGAGSTPLSIGTAGYIMTVVNGHPAWTAPGSLDNIIFSLDPGQVIGRNTSRAFANFTWKDSLYGATGVNLTNGHLTFFSKITGGSNASLSFAKLYGTSNATLISPTLVNTASGAVDLTITTPSGGDGVYELRLVAANNTDVNLYGFQLKFNR